MKTLFSIGVWVYWAICIILFFLIICLVYLVTYPFDRYHRLPNVCLKGLAWVMLKAVPGWSFEIRGAANHKLSEPTIVAANHQSFLDMPLFYLLPWRMKWVVKKDLFKIPIFGWMIFMTGHLAIDRRKLRSFKKLDQLIQPIQAGIPAMIFPEGTRTTDGKLRPFKKGAFKLAKQYNLNILPLIMSGGHQAMPAGTWKVAFKQHFVLSIMDPISADEYETASELKDAVYSLIHKELESLE